MKIFAVLIVGFVLGLFAPEIQHFHFPKHISVDPVAVILIEVECLEWLEDGRYYDDETEEELPCSRYCVGVDEDGEGISVWLNDDMQEVDA